MRVPGLGVRFVVVVRHAAILALALVLLWGVVLVRVCAETPVASCTRVSVRTSLVGVGPVRKPDHWWAGRSLRTGGIYRPTHHAQYCYWVVALYRRSVQCSQNARA